MLRKRKLFFYFICTIAAFAVPLLILLRKSPSVLNKADQVIVDKSNRQLRLQSKGEIIATFRISLGRQPKGHKQQQGDSRTPEGNYILDFKKADSAFYRAIHISYPNEKDSASAKERGVDPGGAIMIHGQRNGFGWAGWLMQYFDWTDGCVALTNQEMELVWQSVDAGTSVTIVP